MKITLSIDSKETLELSALDAANVVGILSDEERGTAFFSLLAEHPCSEIRCAVARSSYLPLKVFKRLARDSSIEVVRTVAGNENAMKQFEVALILEMIARDVSVAATLAENLRFMDEPLHEDVIQSLLQHPDPKVAEESLSFTGGRV
jgi:hypothetical protein